MGKNNMSDKEAALLAAARRELAMARAAGGAATPDSQAPAPSTAKPGSVASAAAPVAAAPLQAPAAPDMGTRMAMLMEAERLASASRKQRIKRIYLIAITAVIVPSFLYVFISLFRLLMK